MDNFLQVKSNVGESVVELVSGELLGEKVGSILFSGNIPKFDFSIADPISNGVISHVKVFRL